MQNSGQRYPRRPRRPYRRNSNGYHDAYDDETEAEDEPYESEAADLVELPANGTRNAIIIGIVTGILSALQGILITLANAPLYRAANALDTSHPTSAATNIAFALAGLWCLTVFISIVLYFIGGFITGRVAVRRRLGFLAGFVAGAITELISFFTHYIPNYPGNQPANGMGGIAGVGGGILTLLILMLVLGVFGGLFGLLGATIATRRHAYYGG